MTDYNFWILNETHFNYFCDCFRTFQRYLNIADWSVGFSFLEYTDEGKASLQISDMYNRVATVSLYNEFDTEPDETALAQVAWHECLELLFGEMTMLARSRSGFTDAAWEKASHRAIRTLENTVFEDLFGKVINVKSVDLQDCKRTGPSVSGLFDDENVSLPELRR